MKNLSALDVIVNGLRDGGCEIITNFPGFESHNIFTKLGGKRISANELIAFEIAYGASLAGKRSVTTMKNVGLNVAADAFLHSVIAGVHAGFVLIVTDDMEVIASQERQDSRHYFDFFGGLWFEPSDIQSAYDIARSSFELSENLDIPIVIRLTNQFFNLKGTYIPKQKKIKKRTPSNSPEKHIVYPVYWANQKHNLAFKNDKVKKYINDHYKNAIKSNHKASNEDALIIAGNCQVEVASVMKDSTFQVLKLNTYPLPESIIVNFLKNKKKIIVLEQGDPYVLEKVKAILAGESATMVIKSNTGIIPDMSHTWKTWSILEKFFIALKRINPSYVVGDVGAFTVETTKIIRACLCLGSAVAVSMGVAEAGVKYPFCIVGDTSFVHNGILSLEEALTRGIKMGIIIIDNDGSWSTGKQKLIKNIYEINVNIAVNRLDYSRTSVEEFQKTLSKMRTENKLSVLYIYNAPY